MKEIHPSYASPLKNPLLLKDCETGLLVVDFQEKLAPKIQNNKQIVNKIIKLIKAIKTLKLQIIHTEQNPLKLGKTIEKIKIELDTPSFTKMAFSCCASKKLLENIKQNKHKNIIVCGIESHICILQTSLELLEKGLNVVIPVDAIGSRNLIDHETSLIRLSNSGAIITTTESIIFELCHTADRDEFKSISKIIIED